MEGYGVWFEIDRSRQSGPLRKMIVWDDIEKNFGHGQWLIALDHFNKLGDWNHANQIVPCVGHELEPDIFNLPIPKKRFEVGRGSRQMHSERSNS